jgi:hypothetical protein
MEPFTVCVVDSDSTAPKVACLDVALSEELAHVIADRGLCLEPPQSKDAIAFSRRRADAHPIPLGEDAHPRDMQLAQRCGHWIATAGRRQR